MNEEKWWCEPIEVIYSALNDNESSIMDVVAILGYPCADIELTIRSRSEHGIEYDYFCCTRGKNGEWNSHGVVDFGDTDPKEFRAEDVLRNDMKTQLVKYCELHGIKMW